MSTAIQDRELQNGQESFSLVRLLGQLLKVRLSIRLIPKERSLEFVLGNSTKKDTMLSGFNVTTRKNYSISFSRISLDFVGTIRQSQPNEKKS